MPWSMTTSGSSTIAGAQYSFSPEAHKQGSYPFYDSPLIASYSAYYRLPLAGVNGPARAREYALTDFGYDEATRRFRPPPPSGTSELLFFASRSSSDTGQLLQSSTLSPAVVPPAGGLQVRDQLLNRTLNPNEDLGGRFSKPLPPAWGIGSSVSAGLDFKNYRSRSLLTRTFGATLFVPEFGSTGPPFVEFPSPPTSTSQETFASVHYLPLSLSWEASRPDRSGLTSFTLGQSFNWGGLLSGKKDFQAATGSTNTDGTYYVVTAGLTREQKVYGEWGVRLHADGQWANEPLISNEQFSLGGLAGVRGYRDGAEYGDTGWRIQFEPHTPYRNLALLFDKVPAVGRLYTFVDYGERYLIDPGARKGSVPMLGAGGGLDLSLGEHADIHLVLGVPLLSTPDRASGRLRAEFSLSAQF